MIIKKIKINKGFVLLFAVVISSIILAIALGVANIAFREVSFSVSGKDANDAFYAADTGAECALYFDKGLSAHQAFPYTSPGGGFSIINCANRSIGFSNPPPGAVMTSSFSIPPPLGNPGGPCANVTVVKDTSGAIPTVTITSDGSNNSKDPNACFPGTNSVSREIQVSY